MCPMGHVAAQLQKGTQKKGIAHSLYYWYFWDTSRGHTGMI